MSNQKEPQDNNAENIVQALKDGYFCYALSYPLKEKNKLLEDITKYLERDKIPFAVIDPLRIDSSRQSQLFTWGGRGQWYKKLAHILNQDYYLEYSPNYSWASYQGIDKNEQFKKVRLYIEKVLFNKRKESKLVIIFDSVIQEQNKLEYRYLFDVSNGNVDAAINDVPVTLYAINTVSVKGIKVVGEQTTEIR